MENKFIYITDIHYGAKPINRKDNYNDAILKKLKYALSIAEKNNCTLLIGGDLFDNPKRLNFMDLNRLIKIIVSFNVDVYCIEGNESHDGIAESSPLELLKYAGIIKKDNNFIDFDNVRIIFRGHNSNPNLKDFLYPKDKTNLLMTHETIVENKVIFEHTSIQDYTTAADIVTIGHYHPYQGIIKRHDGVHFVAPGAITRRKKVSHDINRVPKMVFMKFSENKKFILKELDIPCDMDIWNEKTVIEIDENLFKNIKDEVENMNNELNKNQGAMNLMDALKEFGKVLNASDDVMENVIKRMREM